MEGKIFWVGIIKNPDKEEAKKGKVSSFLVPMDLTIARDEKDAMVRLLNKQSQLLKDINFDLLEVIVSPF